jgi:ribosomal protein S27E
VLGPARRGRKVVCPNCGAEVIVGSGRSGQRVKCPKCTAPIPVDICEPEAQIKSAEPEIAALIEQVARLEARVAALEQQRQQQEHPVSGRARGAAPRWRPRG